MSEKMTLKIDDKTVEFEKGQTILQAAQNSGIYIPNLCYVSTLKPYGGCRLCTVRVVGDRKPFQTACSTPALPNMEVITKDEELQNMRKDVLQMILSEHPNGCLVCSHRDRCEELRDSQEKTGRVFGCFTCSNKDICKLREIVEYLGITEVLYDFEYKGLPLEREDPFFDRDYNLCILCGKCVRVCNELRGISAIHFMNRGHNTKVGTAGDKMHIQSNCQFCGSCVDICPTGVLSPKNTKWVTRKDNFVTSVCNFCGVGCGFDYYYSNEELMESVPNNDSRINQGQACVIGRFCTPQFINSSGRLKDPLIKQGNYLVPRKWEEAYEFIKEKFKQYKPEEIAVIASPDLSNESAYMLNQFATDVLKTQNIATITNGEGIDKFYNILGNLQRSFDKIESSDWILMVNANLQVSHPVLLVNLKKAKDNGAEIISLNLENLTLPNETKRLVSKNFELTQKELLEKITELSDTLKAGHGTIILGQQYSSDLVGSLLNIAVQNENVNFIPLRSRGNIEGVYRLIPKSEDEILQKLSEGKIKALYLTERINSELLKNAEFIVMQDIFTSDSSRLADAVLPGCSFIESSGTTTNAELTVQEFKESAAPFGVSKPDWRIICELAATMDESQKEKFEFVNSEDITALLPKYEFVTLKDEKIYKSSENSRLTGKLFTWESFQYRGEMVSNKVEDLARLINYRKGGETQAKNEAEKPVQKTDFEVVSCEEIVPNMYRLVVKTPLISKKAKPGNFVLLMQFENSERTPITISDWDRENGTITLYFQERGYSTQQLTYAKKGDYLFSVVGPLGNAIEMENFGTVLVGGGCYGMGAMYPIAKAAKEAGNKVITIMEARNRYQLYLTKEFENFADQVVYSTADGSQGLKGDSHGKIATAVDSVIQREHVDRAYFIGCKIMMMEASEATREKEIPTFVSLNTIMLDGTGMCGACRLSIIEDGKEKTKFACVDGPTFNGHIINWDELLQRGTQFIQREVSVYRGHVCRALSKYQKENSGEGEIDE